MTLDDSFLMNGISWRIKFVDPYSHKLVDRTGIRTLATTDVSTRTLFLSSFLSDKELYIVLVHELGHCALYSFGLLDDIHRMVRPEYWIEAEEWVCNFLVDYGLMVLDMAYDILGGDAWRIVPHQIEKVLAYRSDYYV